MKKLLFIFGLIVFSACTEDDGLEDGKCSGVIRVELADGSFDIVPVVYDCAACGERIDWTCPSPGTCGEYTDILNGLFECN